MTTVTSNHKGPLGLPGGQIINPGETVPVENWDKIKDHHHVKTLIEKEVIVVEGVEASASVIGYAVEEKSPGWFIVTFDGVPVTKALRKDDLTDFDVMLDEDKAAFVDLHKPAE